MTNFFAWLCHLLTDIWITCCRKPISKHQSEQVLSNLLHWLNWCTGRGKELNSERIRNLKLEQGLFRDLLNLIWGWKSKIWKIWTYTSNITVLDIYIIDAHICILKLENEWNKADKLAIGNKWLIWVSKCYV